MAALGRYGWPGDVRELRNAVERAVLLSQRDRVTAEDFPLQLTTGGSAGGPHVACIRPSVAGAHLALHTALTLPEDHAPHVVHPAIGRRY